MIDLEKSLSAKRNENNTLELDFVILSNLIWTAAFCFREIKIKTGSWNVL